MIIKIKFIKFSEIYLNLCYNLFCISNSRNHYIKLSIYKYKTSAELILCRSKYEGDYNL